MTIKPSVVAHRCRHPYPEFFVTLLNGTALRSCHLCGAVVATDGVSSYGGDYNGRQILYPVAARNPDREPAVIKKLIVGSFSDFKFRPLKSTGLSQLRSGATLLSI